MNAAAAALKRLTLTQRTYSSSLKRETITHWPSGEGQRHRTVNPGPGAQE